MEREIRMGLFSKRKPDPIVPASTPFDDAWFESWWRRLTSDAGVDPADDQGHLELRWFTMVVLERKAESVMTGMGDPGAFGAFQQGLETTRSPSRMVSLLVGWNTELLPLMEQILDQNGALMIEGGRMHGHFRFGMNGLTSP